MQIEPIAYIETDFKEKFGIPRQSGRVDTLGRIVFLPKYRDRTALRGIEAFSHLWLIFDFSLAHREEFSPTVRPPRLGGNTRVGVFATRSPFRPNSMGLSSVRLIAVEENEKDGCYLVVSGADLLDQTPIYDIKPYLPHSDCHPDAIGGFADDFTNYHLTVDCPDALLSLLPEDKRTPLLACLAEDPRPSYQNDPERVYHMCFADFDISFSVNGDLLTVSKISKAL